MKKKNTKAHAKKRALERYDLELNRKNLLEISALIRNEKSLESFRQSLTKTFHKVLYNGKELYLIYDKKRKDIITFISEDHYVKRKNEYYYDGKKWRKEDQISALF